MDCVQLDAVGNVPLAKQLKAFGFEQSRADRIRKGHEVTMMLVVHVDDMDIAGSRKARDALLEFLNETFRAKSQAVWSADQCFASDPLSSKLHIEPIFAA